VNQPALAQALEELNRWRATVESSVLAGLDSVEAEEAAIQRSIAELERQLRALRSMRERQTRQRDVIGQELKARAWQAVLTSLTEDRGRLMERAALLQQAMVEARADVLEGVREVPGRAAELDGLVTEAVRLRERLQTPGLPAYSRPGVEARLSQARLLAPSDAVVLGRTVEPGDTVQPARALLVLAAGEAAAQLVFQADERNLAALRLGQPEAPWRPARHARPAGRRHAGPGAPARGAGRRSDGTRRQAGAPTGRW
jgi:HlyD family secretion protein